MRVWLLNVGEPLPTDAGHPRLHRTGIFADVLASLGADIVWWSSTFRHADKNFRMSETTARQVHDRLKIWYLHSRPYRRNASLERIFSNADVASEFRKRTVDEPVPDIVVASYPTPELARAGAEYAAAHSIPSIVDIRDLWPDIWSAVLPKTLRPLGRLALLPFVRQSRNTLRQFSGICGITNDILQWGLDRAGRPRGKWDRTYPLAYPQHAFERAELDDAERFWAEQFSNLTTTKLTLCFFGSISGRVRVDVAIDAIKALPEEYRGKVRLVLCGTGEALSALRKSAREFPEIVFPGWVSAPQIKALASISDAGLLPYPSDHDFRLSIPNKAIEYLAHGLPLLTSLKGPVHDLVVSNRCGLTYRETDPGDLATVIVSLLEDPGQLRALSTNALHTYENMFMANRIYGDFASMLANLTRNTKSE